LEFLFQTIFQLILRIVSNKIELIELENADLKLGESIQSPATNRMTMTKDNPYGSPVMESVENVSGENLGRRISQQFATINYAGTKRPRIVTPASSKVIDGEDELRSSPSVRKVSRGSTRDGKENERTILGGIENV
jgi:hypothetical protein